MKKTCFVIVLLCLYAITHAQPTQEEIAAMQQKWQKKMDSLMNDPNVKKYIDNKNATIPASPPKEPKTNSNTGIDLENLKLPPRDSLKIRSIPTRSFSPAELSGYLNELYSLLAKKFPPDAVTSANSIAQKLNNQPTKLEAAALHAWQTGATEEAALLITKAASLDSYDGLLLSNAGAILDIARLPDKAVPILRTVVRYDAGNALAQNNLGQAFTALGMQDSALHYFSLCLKNSPQHPEANNTAGVIELKRGNKEKARSHFENSLRGSFNISAYTGLKSILKEKCRIMQLIMPKVKMPEYFNEFKFQLPRQCLNVNEAAAVEQEHKQFREMMSVMIRIYQKEGKEAEKKYAAIDPLKYNEEILNKIKRGEPIMRPFQVLGGIMEAETILQYNDDISSIQHFNKENRRQYAELEEQYKKEYAILQKKFERDEDDECCGEGDVSCCSDSEAFCRESNALKNKFLPRFAQLNEEWQSRNLQVELKHLDHFLYWCYFSARDTLDYKMRFYIRAVNYLQALNRLAEVKIMEGCDETEAEETGPAEVKKLKEFDCPVDVQIPFIVGKIAMSCEKFSFKAGEGLVFKYEKKFTGDRQSTMSLGAGGGVDLAWKLGGVKAGFEAGMDMSAFLTFDKAGNCTDGGMTFKASRGVGIEFEAGERFKIKKQIGSFGEEFGWRFGIHSGISFTVPDNPFFKETREVQQNKNVKLYNQK